MPMATDSSRITLHPMPPSLMSVKSQSPGQLATPISPPDAAAAAAAQPQHKPLAQSPFHFQLNGPPPPGARPPMIRRGSRFDPMETTAEEEAANDDLGPQHPLRRIREDSTHERSEGHVSLPGIKALLNAADQPPPFISPFTAPSFPPSGALNSSSPVDRSSRYSFASTTSTDGPGWWVPDERSSSPGAFTSSRSGSISKGPLDIEEPDFKRRRSDMAPTLPDADEIARLKWQARSRNASFPVSGSMSAGSGLRTMLYPPLSTSSAMSARGSFSGAPLGSPLSPPLESPHNYSGGASRGSPMTGPLARSFAELMTSESSPSGSRTRSPASSERRPSLFVQRNDSPGDPTTPAGHTTADGPPQRLSLTRPPSPEPVATGPRRSSLAEYIKTTSGDDVKLAKGLFTMTSPPGPSPHKKPSDLSAPPWIARRESTESVKSSTSAGPFGSETERAAPPASNDRRNSTLAPTEARSIDDDEVDPKSDPGMRGMEVLAESARRVADAERKDSLNDSEPSPTKTNNNVSSTGPKYTCQYCAKTFSRPSSLRIHTYSHTGERPFVCKEPSCRRRFSVQSNLKRHAKVHQLQSQQVQVAGHMNPRGPAPSRHPMHMGPGMHPQQPGGYGYPPHPGPPPHPHMVPHSPMGYGPPPPGFMGGRPGFEPHGHFQPPGGARPGPGSHGDHMGGPYRGPPQRHSHDVGPVPGRSGRQDEWSEEEVDELDDDE